ncbi:hypothetical protein [Marinobacter psychrophilus]|uniref:hypothetical protein n=1 Tax=Marinobacter psychrophilus TaxID=330734 RepID=UPI001B5B9440|nr:hypothetical protein [Marinobacter psychrophilus]MBQ0761408.1 hypothetical protein [Marinobacter psychrophilus]MBQ0843416.1 hypothetical protein [Marinobacter psychrophilus]
MQRVTSRRQEITAEDLERYDTQAKRLFKILMEGAYVTRLNLEDYGLAPNRSDLSALVCRVEQKFMVPVERERFGAGPMLHYWIDEKEQERYRRRDSDPKARERQIQSVLWVHSERRQEWGLRAVDHLAADFLKRQTITADRLRQAGEKLIETSKLGEPVAGGRPATGQKKTHSIPNRREEAHGPRSNE